jgi:hypothetical protein
MVAMRAGELDSTASVRIRRGTGTRTRLVRRPAQERNSESSSGASERASSVEARTIRSGENSTR